MRIKLQDNCGVRTDCFAVGLMGHLWARRLFARPEYFIVSKDNKLEEVID